MCMVVPPIIRFPQQQYYVLMAALAMDSMAGS